MTDAELEDKFKSMALKFMTGGQASKLVNTIYRIDELADVSELMRLLAFKS